MSKRRIVNRGIQCEAIDAESRRRCQNIATGYVSLPVRAYICADHRRDWNHHTGRNYLRFDHRAINDRIAALTTRAARTARRGGMT